VLFYLLFGACLALPRRVGLTLLLAAFPVLMVVERLLSQTSFGVKPWWVVAEWWTRIQLLLFAIGVVLAMAQERFGRVVDRHGLGLSAALILLILGPTFMLALRISGNAGLTCAVATIAVALCVLTAERHWERAGLLIRLGDASYVLYLSHATVVGGLSLLWLGTAGPRWSLAFNLIAVGAACAIAWPLHLWLERPVTQLLRALLEQASPRPRLEIVGDEARAG